MVQVDLTWFFLIADATIVPAIIAWLLLSILEDRKWDRIHRDKQSNGVDLSR